MNTALAGQGTVPGRPLHSGDKPPGMGYGCNPANGEEIAVETEYLAHIICERVMGGAPGTTLAGSNAVGLKVFAAPDDWQP